MTLTTLPAETSSLHHLILRFVIDHGYAPDLDWLAARLAIPESDAQALLAALADEHGVVLHPGSSRVWVIHPFSMTTTPFWVEAGSNGWWASCAWCALGVAALIDRDCTIRTTAGGHGEELLVQVVDGQVAPDDYRLHFPIPMRNAWDNVHYTCSTMLLFEREEQIDDWCARHSMAKGDVQSLTKAWQLARLWYGNHLNPQWRKWTVQEAREIFDRCGLEGPIWSLPGSDERF